MKPKTYNIIKWVFFPILFIWQLPQNLVGIGVWIFCKCKGYCKRTKLEDGIVFYEEDVPGIGGVSLGYFIFINQGVSGDELTRHHEFGHACGESLWFGPLYLIIVGIPSGASNVPWLSKIFFGREYHTYYQYYHGFWWEREADYSGSIEHIIPSEGELIRQLA